MQTQKILLLLAVGLASMLQGKPFLTSAHQVDDPAYPHWIAPGNDSPGLYLFRKTFELDKIPESFVVHISADPRYRLWVNGQWVTFGPAAGHFYHWNYETVDIQPYLQQGNNVLAVEVRQAGGLNGPREISFWTGMILAGPDIDGQPLQSDGSWKVKRSPGWQPIAMTTENSIRGYIAGGTEAWDAEKHPWNWTEVDFDDSSWAPALVLNKGSHTGLNTWKVFNYRYLQPRPFPLIKTDIHTLSTIRRSLKEGQETAIPNEWPIEIPAHSEVELLFDNGVMDMGFPMLEVTGGLGSSVTVHYQEALYDEQGNKGNRNVIEGKKMQGIFDRFLPDGSKGRVFEPFWLRAYRYVQLTVKTGEQPLQLDRLAFRQTRYPFDKQGNFETASNDDIEPILDASWRTLELCALETYMDCPYYEQLQYIGDTRIQSLVSVYLTGDDRLMRNAIDQFHYSLQPIGLIRSAFPVSGAAAQLIPPFSFVFVDMLHDHYLLRNDSEFLNEKLPVVDFIVSWFERHLDEDGLMGPLPYWNHTDGGAVGYFNGSPPGSEEGGSVQLSLMLAIALDEAAVMHRSMGSASKAEHMESLSKKIKQAAWTVAWDEEKGMLAETGKKQMFSQHTNAFAILAGVVPQDKLSRLAETIATHEDLVQATLYFQFYVFEAYKKAGRADLILNQLDRWTDFLEMGLTTFPEHHLESRSDAHAWAAHPLYHLLASVAGIRPAEPGFKSVVIEPAPGDLTQYNAKVVHPDGIIETEMSLDSKSGKKNWNTRVSLPDGVEAELKWKGKLYRCGPNVTELELPF